MAKFDQPVQEQGDPNYLRWAKSIEAPSPNLAGAKAIEGATEAITEGTKGLNKFAEQQAQATAEKAADTIQGDYGSSVKALYEKTFPGQSEAELNSPIDSVTNNDTKNVPKPITDGIAYARNVSAARDQGGTPMHIRETEYYRQLFQKASELRSQWPGYRDYIDKGFEKVTGITPTANAYIKSMISELNEAYGKKNSDDTHLQSQFAQHNSIPGVADIRSQYNAGLLTPDQAWHKMAKVTAVLGTAQLAKSTAEIRTSQLGFDEDHGIAAMSAYIPGVVHSAISGVLGKYDLDKMDDATWQSVARDLMVSRAQTEKNIDSFFTGKKNTDGTFSPGIREQMRDKYVDYRKNLMSQYDLWDKIVADKDFSYAKATKAAAESMENQNNYNVLKSKNDTAIAYQALGIAKHFGAGVLAPQTLATLSGSNKPVPDASELRVMLGSAAGGLNLGNITSMKQALGLIDKENKGKSPESNNQHIQDVLNTIANSNATDEEKAHLAKYMFGTKDSDWLSLVKQDSVDPVTGKAVDGRHAVFWRLSKPAFVSQMQQLGGKSLQDYNQWMEDTFKRDIIGPDIHALPALQVTSGLELSMIRNPGKPIQFYGNFSSPDYMKSKYVGRDPSSTEANIKLSLSNLNLALEALHNVQGDRANGNFMQMLANAGVDLRNAPVDSLAHSLMLSIQGNKAPEKPAGASKSSGGSNTTLTAKSSVQPSKEAEEARSIAASRLANSTVSPSAAPWPKLKDMSTPGAGLFMDNPADKDQAAWRQRQYEIGKAITSRFGNMIDFNNEQWMKAFENFGKPFSNISAEDAAIAHQQRFFKERDSAGK